MSDIFEDVMYDIFEGVMSDIFESVMSDLFEVVMSDIFEGVMSPQRGGQVLLADLLLVLHFLLRNWSLCQLIS